MTPLNIIQVANLKRLREIEAGDAAAVKVGQCRLNLSNPS
jgi:hypothetical protein